MPQPSSAAPGEAALASARRAVWRQRGAAGLLVLAGLVSLGTLFFPWTQ
jgi:hypothetical protein